MAGRDELSSVQDFIGRTGVGGFQHVFDDELEIWREYGVNSQPAFVFIDADGNAETVVSSMGEDRLAERLDALVAA